MSKPLVLTPVGGSLAGVRPSSKSGRGCWAKRLLKECLSWKRWFPSSPSVNNVELGTMWWGSLTSPLGWDCLGLTTLSASSASAWRPCTRVWRTFLVMDSCQPLDAKGCLTTSPTNPGRSKTRRKEMQKAAAQVPSQNSWLGVLLTLCGAPRTAMRAIRLFALLLWMSKAFQIFQSLKCSFIVATLEKLLTILIIGNFGKTAYNVEMSIKCSLSFIGKTAYNIDNWYLW